MEEVKEVKTRAKRPEIKVSLKDYTALETYGKATKSSPTKIVNDLITEFLGREEVKKVISENGEAAKKAKAIEKKKAQLEKLKKEIAELEKGEV